MRCVVRFWDVIAGFNRSVYLEHKDDRESKNISIHKARIVAIVIFFVGACEIVAVVKKN